MEPRFFWSIYCELEAPIPSNEPGHLETEHCTLASFVYIHLYADALLFHSNSTVFWPLNKKFLYSIYNKSP